MNCLQCGLLLMAKPDHKGRCSKCRTLPPPKPVKHYVERNRLGSGKPWGWNIVEDTGDALADPIVSWTWTRNQALDRADYLTEQSAIRARILAS